MEGVRRRRDINTEGSGVRGGVEGQRVGGGGVKRAVGADWRQQLLEQKKKNETKGDTTQKEQKRTKKNKIKKPKQTTSR